MFSDSILRTTFFGVVAVVFLIGSRGADAGGEADPLKVVASVPELADLVTQIGGEEVSATALAKGPEDPHFVEARPSFIKRLSQADVYVKIGMELEVGYEPLLIVAARNSSIKPGADGHIDCSEVIEPLEVPAIPVNRAQGDVHPAGNPHFLLDPVNGVRVAALIRDRLGRIRAPKAEYFKSRFEAFHKRINKELFGKELADRYTADGLDRLAAVQQSGTLQAFLKEHGQEKLLGGWSGILASAVGTKVVVDHTMWPYFARRFGFVVVGSLEPKPGIQPTTSHLKDLTARMKVEGVGLILAASYYDPRHAQFVSENTGARLVEMAHQAGSRPGTDSYFKMIDFNVKQVASSLRQGK